MTTIFVVTILIVSIILAIKSIKKNKGCMGGCKNCAHSSTCPAKNIQMILEENRKK